MVDASKVLQNEMGKLALILVTVLFQVFECHATEHFEQTNTSDELLFVHMVNKIDLCFNFDHQKNLTNFFCFKKWHSQLGRHGERSIMRSYPNDPYKSKGDSDEDYAQLTNVSCLIDSI